MQRWQPSADHDAGLALEDHDDGNLNMTGSNGAWDQFETNERLYGVKSDYDENLYTTVIDRSDPLYKERSARAEKIAREIESSNAMNAHVAEERGGFRIDDSGRDEEEKCVPKTEPASILPPETDVEQIQRGQTGTGDGRSGVAAEYDKQVHAPGPTTGRRRRRRNIGDARYSPRSGHHCYPESSPGSGL